MNVRGCSLRDVAVILTIAQASDMASVGEPDWTEDEVVATLTAPNHDPAVDSWLAFDAAGAPLAWAYVDNPERSERENVEVYAVPGEAGHACYAPLLARALTRIAERAREAGRSAVTVHAGAVATEADYIAELVAAGFAFHRRHARMAKPLTAADITKNAEIRVVQPTELRRFHEVLQAAFHDIHDFQPMSYEEWMESVEAQPSTSWDEWLVAERDGVIVGILQSSDQGVDRGEGWIKNLAVLREHRRAGIGAELMRAAFSIYASKGRSSAGLGVDLTNPTGAYHFYEGLGLSVTFAADMYQRTITA